MSLSINGMAERFRELLTGPDIIVLPGCYDVLSAMLMEKTGFPAVFLSGYGVAASFMGNPDIGLTTLTETAFYARNVTNRLGIPVVVDVDNGYGNEDNVMRTIYELEHAGAAAIQMEDQVLPKRCGHSADKKIVPLPHYMKKLEYAMKARQTPLGIIARTDATDFNEGLERAKQFHAAGADATIIDGLKSLDELKRFAEEVPGPKQANLIYGGKTPLLAVSDLEKLGFKIVLYSTPALYIVTKALLKWMKVLINKGDLNSISNECIKFEEFQQLMTKKYSERVPYSEPKLYR